MGNAVGVSLDGSFGKTCIASALLGMGMLLWGITNIEKKKNLLYPRPLSAQIQET